MTLHRILWLLLAALASCLAPAALRAAAYAPAATAAIDWTPNTNAGVGVPGGIPARPTIYTTLTSTGDTTDRRTDIQNALSACPTGQVVLLGPGIFYISYGQYTQGQLSNRTLRGSGSDPATGTVLRSLSGGNGFNIHGPERYNSPNGGNVTGTPVKGATTLSVTGSLTDVLNRVVYLHTENDLTMPVFGTGGLQGAKSQAVFVTAVDTGAGTITFQPPLYQTPEKRTGGALSMRWAGTHGPATIRGFGLEDLALDHIDTDYSFALRAYGMHGCWFRNVRVRNPKNHGMYISESVQIEIRDCVIEGSRDSNWVSSNHGGLGLGDVSGLLFENNIIYKHFPLIKLEGAPVSGCVFGYNFLLQYANVFVMAQHNTGNHCNLWEGNSASGIATDGYFGSAADAIVYRNDLHGVIKDSNIPHFPVQLCRFTRRWEIVGNQMGRTGTTLNFESRYPTPYNWGTNGDTANIWQGDPHLDMTLTGVLTTRTSDTEGVVTFDNSVGYLAGPDLNGNIGITWGDGWWPQISWGFSVDNVNAGAKTAHFWDGKANVLPAQGTAVQVWPGANAYREQDNATLESTVLLGNYYYSDGQIPAGQALGSTTLPDSLYRASAPSFMSGYTWPPYSPTSPDPRYEAIPSGARYVAELNTVSAPTFSPAAGAYSGIQSVTVTTSTSGATIYYTTNGSTPTTSSSVYSSALSIAVSPSTTLKAFAVKSGMTDSSVTSGVYSLAAGGPTTTATATNTTVTGTLAFP